jgi:NAD dependent epimerase/dehydratase family enzyme
MLPPFRMGLGGHLGNGQQWMSWISRDDAIGVIRSAIALDSLNGPVNASSPNPVRNSEFTKLLGAALHRPAVATVPAFALELMFRRAGEGGIAREPAHGPGAAPGCRATGSRIPSWRRPSRSS